jgi:glycosyltransferase involved in cell wall biosynthesis
LFGAIKPYKGLRHVLDAFDAAVAADPPTAPPRRLLVAGAPDRAIETQDFLERARLHPGVTLDARRVPADELAGHLRATDVAILPYDGALNSGVLLLALTFGLPVVVPDLPGFDGLTPSELARRYAAGDATALAGALRDADRFLTPTGRAAASAAAATIVADRHPEALSAAFFAGLLERLG